MSRTKAAEAAAAQPTVRPRRRREGGVQPAPPCTNPPPGAPAVLVPGGKLGLLVRLLSQPQGAQIDEMMKATGWQAHSVRGALSGALKKKLGLTITSTKSDAGRVYRIEDEAAR